VNIKSMFKFENVSVFNTFTDIFEQTKWKIEKQLLKERVEKYKDNNTFQILKDQFTKENISIWPLKDEEVITWMDTLLIMRRAMMSLFKKGLHGEKLKIFMEYPLIYGNHMRTDYLIVYERLIIVLEFGMFNQDEKRSEERYTKKLQESITHRQVLSNMVSTYIKVVNYVMIYRPEYDRVLSRKLEENINYNSKEVELLTEFIMKHFKEQDTLTAISQLEIINIY